MQLKWVKTVILNNFGYGFVYKASSFVYRAIKLNYRLIINKLRTFKSKKDSSQLLQNKFVNKLLFREKYFSDKPLKVAFVVSETGPEASAGDYFTALELGESLRKLGWETCFIAKTGEHDWYQVEQDVDIIISMLESYDPFKIEGFHQGMLKIGWLRNWFEKWSTNTGIQAYDIICASSQMACNFVKNKTGRDVSLLPLATNEKRFYPSNEKFSDLECDYCFTGSYWDDPREIIDILSPNELPFNFKIYGKNWDKVKKLVRYSKGFLSYENIPKLYRSTKIVIDDANRVTKPFGSVNSRVFDALASGALVLTNGEIGANGTFEGKLPVFHNKKELNSLLTYYLNNEQERKKKVAELRNIVLNKHTYDHRAWKLKEIIEDYLKPKIAIKIAAPNWAVVNEWGDYYVALGLKKNFERVGYKVVIHVLPEWDSFDDCDVVIVLRGLNYYKPKPYHLNIMWNISHPDKVSIEEYSQYDYVFIASEPWASEIASRVETDVRPMLQCTDPELFKVEQVPELSHELLFVGNSRNVFRKVIRDAISVNLTPAVYGTNWQQFIDSKYIKGEYISNAKLNRYYSSCKILLNDHWDDMREKGFLSNRIFDALACEAFIMSDDVKSIESIFKDVVVTYRTKAELRELVDLYLTSDDLRRQKAFKGKEIVLNNHTYAERVKEFTKVIDEYFNTIR